MENFKVYEVYDDVSSPIDGLKTTTYHDSKEKLMNGLKITTYHEPKGVSSDNLKGLGATVDYEQIKDDYYYGIVEDFKLVIDQKTGSFNATKLCILGLKNFFEWKRLEQSKCLIAYYENCSGKSQHNFMYEVKSASKDKIDKKISGIYVPKELILDIASWVSDEFYDRCNNIIINYFVKFSRMDNDTLKQRISGLEEQVEKLTLENQEKENIIKEKINQNNELKHIVLWLEDSREKDRDIMMKQEQYVHFVALFLEEVKDQNEEILERNKGLEKDVNEVKRKLGIKPDHKSKKSLTKILFSIFYIAARKLKLNQI
jgi:flagellar biosynthesis/type III secretory pathway chaperone